jgi:hypothetical protein
MDDDRQRAADGETAERALEGGGQTVRTEPPRRAAISVPTPDRRNDRST